MTNYSLPADLLQAILNVLNKRPAEEVFNILVAVKYHVDQQNAQKPVTRTNVDPSTVSNEHLPSLGRQ